MEDFERFKNVKPLETFKGGIWLLTGNAEIGNRAKPRLFQGDGSYNGAAGQRYFANPKLKMGNGRAQLDLGIDFGFF